MAYQSLYRRYRPRGFAGVVGQSHVVTALRNAVRDERASHAYLFSGPRGTGKTSTARILAKALNCTALVGGEPCSACASCLSIEAGTSYDLHELDAASHNGVEAMRELIAKAALGSPGRTKVYILDEVHMLSTAASNALLKTLEEPPDHVTFVLATTDPQKVLPTIRSRTQQFAFGLIPANELADHLRFVIDDAGLGLGDDAIEAALRSGGGSARDTLSALDQIAAAGGVDAGGDAVGPLMAALVGREPGAAIVGVADAVNQGRDPRVLGEALLGRLRDTFLAAMNADLSHLQDVEHDQIRSDARSLGPAALTRALQTLGEALIEMRQAPDPRIPLEVALVRLARPAAERSTDGGLVLEGLIERIEQLEARLAAGVPSAPSPALDAPAPSPAGAPPASGLGSDPSAPIGAATPQIPSPASPPSSSVPSPAPEPTPARAGPAALARARLAEAINRSGTTPPAGARPAAGSADRPAAGSADRTAAPSHDASGGAVPEANGGASVSLGAPPSLAELTTAWEDSVLEGLAPRVKAMMRAGRFLGSDAEAAVFALPNEPHRQRCEEVLADVETGLRGYFGRPVPVRLTVDDDPQAVLPRSEDSAPIDSSGEIEVPSSAVPVEPAGEVQVLPGAEGERAARDPAGGTGATASEMSPPRVAASEGSVVASESAAEGRWGENATEAQETSDGRSPVGEALEEEYEIGNVHELEDATGVATSIVDQLTEAFPGAELL